MRHDCRSVAAEQDAAVMTSASPRRIATARGELVLRPERPDDEAFLFRLFVANNSGMLQQAGIPQATIDHLIGFQYKSQTATYRGMFPNALFSIVEFNGEPIG